MEIGSDKHEARAVMRYVYDVRFGLTTADVCAGRLDELSADDKAELERIKKRLAEGEPVQYAIGRAAFGGRLFGVSRGVFIPRPETEELCEWVINDYRPVSLTRRDTGGEPLAVLDLCTGSGCIAVTIALSLPGARVTACDISDKALSAARTNAARLGADIEIVKTDVLLPPAVEAGSDNCKPGLHEDCGARTEPTNSQPSGRYDVFVSNPPYICLKESADMERNVLDYEPHEALFVPDDNPLLFYRAIARRAAHGLKSGGSMYLEINPLYVSSVKEMLSTVGFATIETRRDFCGKERFVKATRQ